MKNIFLSWPCKVNNGTKKSTYLYARSVHGWKLSLYSSFKAEVYRWTLEKLFERFLENIHETFWFLFILIFTFN